MKPRDNQVISDETLNAYIDDELNAEERERVFRHLSQDTALGQQACETQQLQYLLRQAYQTPPRPARRPGHHHGVRSSLGALAAGLMLAVGSVLGWYSHTLFPTDVQRTASASEDARIHNLTRRMAANGASTNIIMHVNSAEPARLQAVLDKAETLLKRSRQEAKPFRLEIIANNSGVELLRRNNSPYAQRVSALMQQYDNLHLMACANALQQLRQQGVELELLPGVQTGHTAVEVIIERLDEGWSYLRV